MTTRVLAENVKIWRCAVDDDFLYGSNDQEIYRIDRNSGQSELVTNDARSIAALLPVDGELFWYDADGVHVWSKHATTRTTVSRFPSGVTGNGLVQFDNKVCWGISGGVAELRVDCFDLKTRSISTRTTFPGVGIDIATLNRHIYAAIATLDRTCQILDLSKADVTVPIATMPHTCGVLDMTSEGPSVYSDDHHWIVAPTPQPLPDVVVRLTEINGRKYALTSAGPKEINGGVKQLAIGTATLSPLPQADGGMLCGDSRNLYVRARSGPVVEITYQHPSHNTD